uniref:Uncharacterized protein n=1 Tax=Anopheles christyi TaxID=43041 RepID=A0A182K2L4_9DIPT
MILTPTDHLSPPSTTSRLSDSDTTSECDIDGLMTGRDGASVSSLGSSSSPPPEQLSNLDGTKYNAEMFRMFQTKS